MYGNILNNGGIDKLIKDKRMTITPYNSAELQTIHYPVYPGALKRADEEGNWVTVRKFDENKSKIEIEPFEFVQIAIAEHIELPKEIVGEFILASNTIDKGLGIHAGRIEFPFGSSGERMHIGVKNLLNRPNFIDPDQKIAYIKFIDTSGVKSIEIAEPSKEELAMFEKRIMDKVKLMQADGGAMFDPREIITPEKKK